MRDWLNYRFENNSNDTFLQIKGRNFSYQEIGNIVYDRALALYDLGVIRKQKVGIFLSDPSDFIEAYLSCYKIQATSVIFNTKWKKDELKRAIDRVSIDFIICSFKDRKLFTQFRKPIIFIEELSKSFGSCAPKKINAQINQNDIQSILFTSGTEGIPKPVCLTYENFFQSSMKWKKAVKLNSQDKYLLCLPLYHIGGLAIIMRALHIGFTININMDIKNSFDLIESDSIISVVPTLLKKLINMKSHISYLQGMRCIILSGGIIPQNLLKSCIENSLNVFISYGMTETCSGICGRWVENDDLGDLVGTPFDGVDITVENNRIVIQSSTIMKQYYNGELNNGLFITSDKGKLHENSLVLRGRIDETVISGGENIDSSEVIHAITKIIPSCRIVPIKKNDSNWGEILGVIIYTNENIQVDILKSELQKVIADYKIPKEIIIKQND